MSLPSQAPRPAATGRTFMRTHRRRRFRFGPIALAGVIVLAAAGAVWWLARGDGTGNLLGPETTSAAAADTMLDAPHADTRLAPATHNSNSTNPGGSGRVEPLTINQGGDRGVDSGSPQGDRGTAAEQDRPPFVLDQPRTLGESLEQVNDHPQTGRQENAARPSSGVSRALAAAAARLDAKDPVAARIILSDALAEPSASEAERSQLRARLTELNQELLFSPTVVAGDPLTDTYEIVSGDRLSKLPSKLGLAIDWRLLQTINKISDPNRIRLGQKIKTVSGPFHAVVDKSDYRLDVYQGAPDEPERWTYIRSFRVGLGEADSTPTGEFIVRRDSKLINPHWVNPRTGERFDQDDPENPIGERWIGLDGLGADAVKTGYGIHGTIDPGSIGQQKSMGCVRMHDEDVELMYGLLVEGISLVRIRE